MKVSAEQILARNPGAPSKKWPAGERYMTALAHGSISVGLYAPLGTDLQTPHAQGEVYIVRSGHADFVMAGQRAPCATGDVLFPVLTPPSSRVLCLPCASGVLGSAEPARTEARSR